MEYQRGRLAKRMKISIVIPTLNRKESLRRVFEDLRLQTHKDFEVIVVDGGSTDQTEALCDAYREYFDVRFYHQTKPAIVGAINEGFSYCKGDIFTRTDDDVALPENWLSRIEDTFIKHPDAGGVTGPTIIPSDRADKRDLTAFNDKISHPRSLFWRLFRQVYHGYFMEGKPFAISRFYRCGAFSLGSNYDSVLDLKETLEVDYLESCNWSVKMDLLGKVGGFDNRYGGVSEYCEADVVYKIRRMGLKMYFNPKANIWHLVDRGGNFKARSGTFGRAHNFILFYLRHIKPNTLDKALRFSLYLVFINLYFIYCAIKQRQLSQLSGIPGTILTLFKYSPELFKKNPETVLCE